MQTIVLFVVDIAVTALAVFLSLKQRWLDSRRMLVLRSVAIWLVASVLVVVAGMQILGSVAPGLAVAGSLIVVVLAAMASAAR